MPRRRITGGGKAGAAISGDELSAAFEVRV